MKCFTPTVKYLHFTERKYCCVYSDTSVSGNERRKKPLVFTNYLFTAKLEAMGKSLALSLFTVVACYES